MTILSVLAVSSIWISLAAAGCPLLISIVYDQPYNPVHSIITFLACFFVYTWDKVSGSKEDLLNTPERAFLAKYPMDIIALTSCALSLIIVALFDFSKILNVLWFCLAGRAYAERIHGWRLKDIPGLKSPYVAAAWSIGFAGLSSCGYSLIFFLILINTIIFDLRDMKGDSAAGVKTIPVLIGRSRTIGLLAILDLVLFTISPIVAMIGAVIIYYFRVDRPNLYYDYIVDGWILYAIVLSVQKVYIGM